MDSTNNPDSGTGYSVAQAAEHIENYLDSEGTIQEVDADGADEAQDTEIDEVSDEAEQPEQDSEENVDEGNDEGERETDEQESNALADDTTVDVQGEKVSLKELKDGYLRRANFTQKTQELKAHMARYQVQERAIEEIRAEALNHIAQIKQEVAREFRFEEPNWDQLLADDPVEFLKAKNDWERKQAAVRQLHHSEQMLAEKNIKTQREQMAIQQANEMDALIQKYPEFGDKQKADPLLTGIGEFLVDSGFSKQEIEGIADHRIMDIVYRAYKAGLVQKNVPQVVKHIEKKPPLTMPGSAQKVKPQSDYQKDVQRYKRSGDMNDAISAISKLL